MTGDSVDLRLVPAAAAAWAGAAVTVLCPGRAPVVAAVAPALAIALVALRAAVRHGRGAGVPPVRRSGAPCGAAIAQRPGPARPTAPDGAATALRPGPARPAAPGGAATALGPDSACSAAPGCAPTALGPEPAPGAGGSPGRSEPRRRSPAGDPAAALALAVLVLLGALAAGGAMLRERSTGPLAESVRAGWTATVRGRVADAPVALAASWGGADARVRYTLAVESVEARGRSSPAHGEVVVLGGGEPPVLGATVVVTGRLQPPTGSAGRPVGTLVANGVASTTRGPAGVDRWVGRVRASAASVVAQVPGDAGGLLLGVALGDTSRVDQGLSDAFKVAGLTHLVAVSGSHFAIIGALVAAAAAGCRLPRAGRAAAVLLAGVLLVLLVGPQPSVLRAAVMGSLSLVGLLAGRPARAPAALAATVVVLLLADPWLAVELGFALSVAATAAIVLLAGLWTERWAPRLGRGLAGALAVPLAAQLACGPVLLAVRPQVGAYALAANVLVAPAVGPATVFGVAAALLAPVWPGAALVLAHLGGAACWWIAAVGRTVAATPGAGVGWAPGVVGFVALAAASVAVGALLLRAGRSPDEPTLRPRSSRAGTTTGAGRAVTWPSAGSGRLGPCRPPPVAPPVAGRRPGRPR